MFKIENENNPTTIEVNSIMSLHNVGKNEDAFDACKGLINKYPNSPLLYNIFGVINAGKSDFNLFRTIVPFTDRTCVQYSLLDWFCDDMHNITVY